MDTINPKTVDVSMNMGDLTVLLALLNIAQVQGIEAMRRLLALVDRLEEAKMIIQLEDKPHADDQ